MAADLKILFETIITKANVTAPGDGDNQAQLTVSVSGCSTMRLVSIQDITSAVVLCETGENVIATAPTYGSHSNSDTDWGIIKYEDFMIGDCLNCAWSRTIRVNIQDPLGFYPDEFIDRQIWFAPAYYNYAAVNTTHADYNTSVTCGNLQLHNDLPYCPTGLQPTSCVSPFADGTWYGSNVDCRGSADCPAASTCDPTTVNNHFTFRYAKAVTDPFGAIAGLVTSKVVNVSNTYRVDTAIQESVLNDAFGSGTEEFETWTISGGESIYWWNSGLTNAAVTTAGAGGSATSFTWDDLLQTFHWHCYGNSANPCVSPPCVPSNALDIKREGDALVQYNLVISRYYNVSCNNTGSKCSNMLQWSEICDPDTPPNINVSLGPHQDLNNVTVTATTGIAAPVITNLTPICGPVNNPTLVYTGLPGTILEATGECSYTQTDFTPPCTMPCTFTPPTWGVANCGGGAITPATDIYAWYDMTSWTSLEVVSTFLTLTEYCFGPGGLQSNGWTGKLHNILGSTERFVNWATYPMDGTLNNAQPLPAGHYPVSIAANYGPASKILRVASWVVYHDPTSGNPQNNWYTQTTATNNSTATLLDIRMDAGGNLLPMSSWTYLDADQLDYAMVSGAPAPASAYLAPGFGWQGGSVIPLPGTLPSNGVGLNLIFLDEAASGTQPYQYANQTSARGPYFFNTVYNSTTTTTSWLAPKPAYMADYDLFVSLYEAFRAGGGQIYSFVYPSKASSNAALNQTAGFPNFCTAAIFSGNRDTDAKNNPAYTDAALNEGVGGVGTGLKDGHWEFGTVDAIHPNGNPVFQPPHQYVFEPEWTIGSAMWLAGNAVNPTDYPIIGIASTLGVHMANPMRRNVLWDAPNTTTVATTYGGSTGTRAWRPGEHDYGYGGLDNYQWDANVACAPFTLSTFDEDLTQYIENEFGSGGPCSGAHCITIEVTDDAGIPIPNYPITHNLDSAGVVPVGTTNALGIFQYSLGPGAIPTTSCVINSCMDIMINNAANGGSAPSGGTMGDCKQTRIQIFLAKSTFVVGANITAPCCPTIGCMDPLACNYDSSACVPCDSTPPDGTGASTVPGSLGECCIYTAGCTDPNANNYDATATNDCGCNILDTTPGSAYMVAGTPQSGQTNYGDTSCCLYSGCLDPSSVSYNPVSAHIGCNSTTGVPTLYPVPSIPGIVSVATSYPDCCPSTKMNCCNPKFILNGSSVNPPGMSGCDFSYIFDPSCQGLNTPGLTTVTNWDYTLEIWDPIGMWWLQVGATTNVVGNTFTPVEFQYACATVNSFGSVAVDDFTAGDGYYRVVLNVWFSDGTSCQEATDALWNTADNITFGTCGCTNPLATNYNAAATCPCNDAGVPNDCCLGVSGCTSYGCIDTAAGPNPDVNGLDSTLTACTYPCANGYAALNYDPAIAVGCPCDAAGTALGTAPGQCCTYCVYGCNDPSAANYNPLATCDAVKTCNAAGTGCCIWWHVWENCSTGEKISIGDTTVGPTMDVYDNNTAHANIEAAYGGSIPVGQAAKFDYVDPISGVITTKDCWQYNGQFSVFENYLNPGNITTHASFYVDTTIVGGSSGGDCSACASPCPLGQIEVELLMTDDNLSGSGLGWDGWEVTFTGQNTGAVYGPFTINSGSAGFQRLCMKEDCYTNTVVDTTSSSVGNTDLMQFEIVDTASGVSLTGPHGIGIVQFQLGSAYTCCIYGCMNSLNNFYDPSATCHCDDTDPQALLLGPACVGSQSGPDCCCEECVFGCTDPSAHNFDPLATCDCDISGTAQGNNECCCFDDGCPDNYTVHGYSNPTGACNYNPLACADCNANVGGSDTSCCHYPGCTDPSATNYDSSATCPCNGTTGIPGVDNDCCTYCVYGCMNPGAANYDPLATCPCDATNVGCTTSGVPTACSGPGVGWGQCCDIGIAGCMDGGLTGYTAALGFGSADDGITALNYNALATVDDGSCVYCTYGCTNSSFTNYDPSAGCACDDADPNSLILSPCVNDLSGTMQTGIDCCCTDCIYGCTDPTVSNYNPLATCDDGSCCVDGCTDPTQCVYDPAATCDNGSCSPCTTGCADATALNYDPLIATNDPDACFYCNLATGQLDNSFSGSHPIVSPASIVWGSVETNTTILTGTFTGAADGQIQFLGTDNIANTTMSTNAAYLGMTWKLELYKTNAYCDAWDAAGSVLTATQTGLTNPVHTFTGLGYGYYTVKAMLDDGIGGVVGWEECWQTACGTVMGEVCCTYNATNFCTVNCPPVYLQSCNSSSCIGIPGCTCGGWGGEIWLPTGSLCSNMGTLCFQMVCGDYMFDVAWAVTNSAGTVVGSATVINTTGFINETPCISNLPVDVYTITITELSSPQYICPPVTLTLSPPAVICDCTDATNAGYNPSATHNCDGTNLGTTLAGWDDCCTGCADFGCTDPNALNYDASILPGCECCCTYDIPGCMDPDAQNYNIGATVPCDLINYSTDCCEYCPVPTWSCLPNPATVTDDCGLTGTPPSSGWLDYEGHNPNNGSVPAGPSVAMEAAGLQASGAALSYTHFVNAEMAVNGIVVTHGIDADFTNYPVRTNKTCPPGLEDTCCSEIVPGVHPVPLMIMKVHYITHTSLSAQYTTWRTYIDAAILLGGSAAQAVLISNAAVAPPGFVTDPTNAYGTPTHYLANMSESASTAWGSPVSTLLIGGGSSINANRTNWSSCCTGPCSCIEDTFGTYGNIWSCQDDPNHI